MAKARRVIADQSSEEFDQLRRSVNTILVVLQNVAAEVDAGNITADEAFTALYSTLSTGLDSTIANIDSGANTYTGLGVTIEGLIPSPKHPRRVRFALQNEDLDPSDL